MKLAALSTHNVISVTPDDSFDRAISLMEEHGFHHLPVVESGKVVGMITDRDLLLAVGWKLEAERRVEGSRSAVVGPRRVREVMSRPVVSLTPEESLHTAARTMIDRAISAIPLVSGAAVVGIVTKIDLLRGLCEANPPVVKLERLAEGVSRHMRHNVFTVGPKDALHTAARMMHDKHVRHLPVTVDSMLVGMLSDRDIRRACGREIIEDEQAQVQGKMYAAADRVMEVMTTQVHTVGPSATLKDAAKKMLEHRIGALPVVTGELLVGILTHTDVLRLIAESQN